MKTAVSVPDDIFLQADRLARRSRRTRSEVYSSALREYIQRHDPDLVTHALDRVMEEVGDDRTGAAFTTEATRRVLASVEW